MGPNLTSSKSQLGKKRAAKRKTKMIGDRTQVKSNWCLPKIKEEHKKAQIIIKNVRVMCHPNLFPRLVLIFYRCCFVIFDFVRKRRIINLFFALHIKSDIKHVSFFATLIIGISLFVLPGFLPGLSFLFDLPMLLRGND